MHHPALQLSPRRTTPQRTRQGLATRRERHPAILKKQSRSPHQEGGVKSSICPLSAIPGADVVTNRLCPCPRRVRHHRLPQCRLAGVTVECRIRVRIPCRIREGSGWRLSVRCNTRRIKMDDVARIGELQLRRVIAACQCGGKVGTTIPARGEVQVPAPHDVVRHPPPPPQPMSARIARHLNPTTRRIADARNRPKAGAESPPIPRALSWQTPIRHPDQLTVTRHVSIAKIQKTKVLPIINRVSEMSLPHDIEASIHSAPAPVFLDTNLG